MEGDMITANVRVALTRPSHADQKVNMDAEKVKAVEAYAPHYPIPREEKWYFLLADVPQNILMSNSGTGLVKAESAGAAQPDKYLQGASDQQASAAAPKAPAATKASAEAATKAAEAEKKAAGDEEDDDDDFSEDEGKALVEAGEDDEPEEDKRQLIQLKFMAPPAGKYNLQLLIMSDCWIGCDKTVNAPLVVEKLNRAEREARDNAVYQKPFDDSDDEDEHEDEDASESDYDSEDTGTDVSDDEGDDAKDDEDEDSDESLPDLVHVDRDDIPGIDSQGNVKETR